MQTTHSNLLVHALKAVFGVCVACCWFVFRLCKAYFSNKYIYKKKRSEDETAYINNDNRRKKSDGEISNINPSLGIWESLEAEWYISIAEMCNQSLVFRINISLSHINQVWAKIVSPLPRLWVFLPGRCLLFSITLSWRRGTSDLFRFKWFAQIMMILSRQMVLL